MSWQVLMSDNRVVWVQAVSASHAAMRAINLMQTSIKGICPINSPYVGV